jgi:hypothetical protein
VAETRGHVTSSSDQARLHGAKSRSLRTSQGNARSSFNSLRHGRSAVDGIAASNEGLRFLRIPSPSGSAVRAHSADLFTCEDHQEVIPPLSLSAEAPIPNEPEQNPRTWPAPLSPNQERTPSIQLRLKRI